MPLVIIEGPALDLDGKRKLAKELTAAVAAVYGLPAVAVDVLIRETPPENFSRGGELVADANHKRGG